MVFALTFGAFAQRAVGVQLKADARWSSIVAFVKERSSRVSYVTSPSPKAHFCLRGEKAYIDQPNATESRITSSFMESG
jgi:hypothetical protein